MIYNMKMRTTLRLVNFAMIGFSENRLMNIAAMNCDSVAAIAILSRHIIMSSSS